MQRAKTHQAMSSDGSSQQGGRILQTSTRGRNAMRFASVHLALNISPVGHAPLGTPGLPQGDCNPGGSTICDPGTKGCGAGGMTCVGTSTNMDCVGGSEIFDLGLDARINVQETELKALRAELQKVMSSFAARHAK
jgi:hypothetical protein